MRVQAVLAPPPHNPRSLSRPKIAVIGPLTVRCLEGPMAGAVLHQERPIFVSRLGGLQSRPSFSAIGNLQPRQDGAILWHGLAAMPSFRLAHPSENRSCSQPENMSPH